MAKRIQRKRTKGWRLPEGAVCVTRPGKFGNPFKVGDLWYIVDNFMMKAFEPLSDNPNVVRINDIAECLRLFRIWYGRVEDAIPGYFSSLRGKDLACWCPLPKPGEPDLCHAAILLELSNV